MRASLHNSRDPRFWTVRSAQLGVYRRRSGELNTTSSSFLDLNAASSPRTIRPYGEPGRCRRMSMKDRASTADAHGARE